MTVKELIEKLKKVPQNYLICISIDEEGNAFHRIGAVELTDRDVVIWPGEECFYEE